MHLIVLAWFTAVSLVWSGTPRSILQRMEQEQQNESDYSPQGHLLAQSMLQRQNLLMKQGHIVTEQDSKAIFSPNWFKKRSGSLDLLTITKVECKKPQGPFSAAGKVGFQVLGALTAAAAMGVLNGAIPLGANGLPTTQGLPDISEVDFSPETLGNVLQAAKDGKLPTNMDQVIEAASSGAIAGVALPPSLDPKKLKEVFEAGKAGKEIAGKAADFLQEHYSGTDEVVVKVDGQQVSPKARYGSKYLSMSQGTTNLVNVRVSFRTHARIQLMEWDWFTAHDDLGHLDVVGGRDKTLEDVMIVGKTSVYAISLKIEAGKGNRKSMIGYLLCGPNKCIQCLDRECYNQDWSGLTRVTSYGKGDVMDCIDGFEHLKWERYPQWWPYSDKYLRVCIRQ